MDKRFKKIFSGMIERCSNLKGRDYRNYGGRGVKNLWSSFEEFKKDMHESYKSHIKMYGVKNTSIDRIDNNGDYCKENCRWATRMEQQKNRRTNRVLTYNGKAQILSEWARDLKINRQTLHARLVKGWSVEKALSVLIAQLLEAK